MASAASGWAGGFGGLLLVGQEDLLEQHFVVLPHLRQAMLLATLEAKLPHLLPTLLEPIAAHKPHLPQHCQTNNWQRALRFCHTPYTLQ